jgi:hypothetical protein
MTGRVKCNTDGMMLNISQLGERVVRGISDVMKEEGEIIARLAQSFAPIDDGYLRAAIRMESDRSGVNGRTVVRVFVDMTAPGANGKLVGDYAMLVHEHLTPYGDGAPYIRPWGHPGAALVPGHARHGGGGKFMERAIDLRTPILMERVYDIVTRKIA